MRFDSLDKAEINYVIDSYLRHKREFIDLLTIEDFLQQFCRRCDMCNRVICILDMCEECDVEKGDNQFQEFELNKEYYVYKI